MAVGASCDISGRQTMGAVYVNDFTPDQHEALQIAHELVDLGAAVFLATRNHSVPLTASMPFHLPGGWQETKAGTGHGYIDRWRPGMALAMVTGIGYDVLDVDPRNGGREGAQELAAAGAWPLSFGQADTPSDGGHYLIARTHLAKGKPAEGVDLQAGEDDGNGRGFVFLAPTVRISKYGPRKGEPVAYRWVTRPTAVTTDAEQEPTHRKLVEASRLARAPRTTVTVGPARSAAMSEDDDLFGPALEAWTPESADRVINGQLAAVRAARAGTVNNALGGAARVLGRFVAGGHLTEDAAVEALEQALEAGGVHSDAWNAANGLGWTARQVIARGLANGSGEPWTVAADEAPPVAPGGAPSGPLPAVQGMPSLLVESAAVMAYWLQQELGRGPLSGFFLRSGQVVHTPRIGEDGYVAPRAADDDNGPVEIRPVTEGQLAARVQYAYRCEKDEDVKSADGKRTGEKRRVPALFPKVAASTAVNAPEDMQALRALKGVTLTPMMRADGSVLSRPGYDDASGYLYLPSGGLTVPEVPGVPTDTEVASARELLLRMVADFPFGTPEDRANYLGLLITPLIREMAPPSYKLFGIGAHQPGSGKSLLAQIAQTIHGGVWRTEVPQEEAEWTKATMSILATTSAPLVTFDNVTGVLKSSALAGLLTTSGDLTDRELGSNTRTVTARNDRVWCVTGNNLSLGGDLVRRTILIMINPDMANPETRTKFVIPDLASWVAAHRGEVLHALLTLVRAWACAGRPCPQRKQSDSFAAWESAVAGILAHAGVPGEFDQESGKRAAGGGDDEGLARVLDHLWERFAGRKWTVAQALEPIVEDGVFGIESRDWVPAPVLEKLARSEVAGRISLGWWFKNRLGRWVTGLEGGSLVIRDEGLERKVQQWRVERRG